MGSILGCSQNCYSWMRGYSQTVADLRMEYRRLFKNTIFYPNCEVFIEQLHRLTQNGHGLNEEFEGYKGSLIDSVHYGQAAISDKNHGRPIDGLPTRINSLSADEKKELISDLIKKSYILLDIADIFNDEEESHSYEIQIKQKIFENDQSMMTESFFDGRDALADSLRKFDTITIFKLEKYVEMAQKIKKSFDVSSESLLSKFLLHIKSRLIQFFNTSEDLQALFKNTRILLAIVELTITILFDLNLPSHPKNRKSNSSRSRKDSHHSIGSRDDDEERNMIQFLNQTNLSTLVSCLVFDEAEFHEFYQKAILSSFKQTLDKFKKQSALADQFLLGKLLGSDPSLNNYFEPTLVGLFNKRTEQVNYFQKTVKMFQKLPTKYPPVLKLKLLAEVEKQFVRELKKLCDSKKIEVVYDRTVAQLMAQWLLNRDKSLSEKSIASIIIAYSFVHSLYRLGAKGSTVLSYVEQVERILSWSVPTQ